MAAYNPVEPNIFDKVDRLIPKRIANPKWGKEIPFEEKISTFQKALDEQRENDEKIKEIIKKLEILSDEVQIVKFDVSLHRGEASIDQVNLVDKSGNQITLPFEYIKTQKGRTNTLRKVGAFIMPLGTPTSIQLYTAEMKDAISKPLFKSFGAAVIGVIAKFLGANILGLAAGLFFLAVLDMALSWIPGNIKAGTEKDHSMQAKLYAFTTNFLVLVGIIKGIDILKAHTAGNDISDIVSDIMGYTVAGWIYMIYLKRMVTYVARANKTRVPKRIKKFFNNDEDVTM